MHLGYIRLRKISNCLPPHRLQNTVQYVSTVGPVAVVLVLGPEVAVARAERLRLRRGGGGRSVGGRGDSRGGEVPILEKAATRTLGGQREFAHKRLCERGTQ